MTETIEASALRGIISPAYVVMRLRKDDDLPRYFHHLYRDVVTDKGDVREAAARLPDEAVADMVEDDTGLSDDDAQLAESED
jgi:hypothetical protein